MFLKQRQSTLSILSDNQALSEEELNTVSGGGMPSVISRPDYYIDPVTGLPYGTGIQPIQPPPTNETRKQPPTGSLGSGFGM